MQQKEFEELTGLQVAPEEYYEIEQIYNTADTIDKKESANTGSGETTCTSSRSS